MLTADLGSGDEDREELCVGSVYYGHVGLPFIVYAHNISAVTLLAVCVKL